MKRTMGVLFGGLLLGVSLMPGKAQEPVDAEFFEKRIRPILTARCVSCHGQDVQEGNLRLDSAAGLKKGGARGAALATNGTLLKAVSYTSSSLLMPPTGKLPTAELALIEQWVKGGAPVPATTTQAPPAPTSGGAKKPGFDLTQRRQHWAYKQVQRPLEPPMEKSGIDAFVLAKLKKSGLTMAPEADKRTLIRRVTFDLTGLPPTPSEIAAFLADSSPNAYEKVVDRLLASPAYGERWARHWLDLVRYGESMGHELDFDIPEAFQYRDYVIRALNADVPYNQFITEHLAGDLLPTPRYDRVTGRNESLTATGFVWLGEGKHSPVDIKQEQADRIDNQIDVIGKAMLGQTLACARCHDHKFDPIPTKDYYGLYGVLRSSRFQLTSSDGPATFGKPAAEIAKIRAGIDKRALSERWKASLAALPAERLKAELLSLNRKSGGISDFPLAQWTPSGAAMQTLVKPGELVLSGDPQKPVLALAPRTMVHSALNGRHQEGALRSPTFTIDKDFIHVNVAGQRGKLRIIVESFQVIRDPLYGFLTHTIDNPEPGWRTIDLRMVKGRRAYVELTDSARDNFSLGNLSDLNKGHEGWIRCEGAVLSNSNVPPGSNNLLTILDPEQVRALLSGTLRSGTLDRWVEDRLLPADDQVLEVLDLLLRKGLLDTKPLGDVSTQLAAIDNALPAPTRILAMADGDGEDENVFLRGNHKAAGPVAPRLQLALCGTENTPISGVTGSGRLELAKRIASPQHPLTARVIVNRLWHHHFGRGIVPTVDDFGHMGEAPTHPELLDYLASELVAKNWSLKTMHKLILTSATYKQRSDVRPTATATKLDPTNKLLWRMNVLRLEGESIRDSLLALSGRLDPTLYGPPVNTYLTEFSEGRGRPGQGPLDGNGRRSIYLSVRRNFLSPWLQSFDFPTPFTCIGRRSISNVPAQALALMNGPFVRQQAEVWATRLLKEQPTATPEQRIAWLYERAFSRPATAAEMKDALEFVAPPAPASGGEKQVWADLCHVLLNVKEFIFIK
ncbi:PSD1 and planctomycete cytochrome C domain-containing protein [Armatimonas rosea]|uniref:Cytochrome c domain-containing protein n=1 Tax=Armatimonas rosea TaxID=685828 RepID=A0A7W9W6V1_ARMRO|nr:PSD1 and planctomycete cytochrome C domain-containing protein [Armatimonas rosea]MBB6049922.1 hypothetical protein [Armatimonas rosea]